MTASDLSMIQPSWWARVLGRATNYQSAELTLLGIRIKTTNGKQYIAPFELITDVRQKNGLFWSTITLASATGAAFSLTGIPANRAAAVAALIKRRLRDFVNAAELVRDGGDSIEALAAWIEEAQRGHHWVANQELTAHKAKAHVLAPVLGIDPKILTRDPRRAEQVARIASFRRDPDSFCQQANQRFVTEELERFREYFDTVESNPLTESQRLAVVTHEDNTRVIAGAGSGKTSVIVAKAGYLLKSGLCAPSKLLLMAFNKNAAKELSERIRARVGLKVRASTFHALGLSILGEVEGRKPSLSNLAEDKKALMQLIRGLISELIRTPLASAAIRLYFQSFFAPEQSEFEFASLGDYYAYLNRNNLVTLRGEAVKSFAEAEIANFLCLNGIEYLYEPKYEVKVGDTRHRQYQPDFYLPRHGVYIEHFGIARDGSTARYIDQKSYEASMDWKRQVHAEHNTRLIETYSYEKSEGTLLANLEKKLRQNGVALEPISSEEVFRLLNASDYIDPFSNLVAIFLNHFKGNNHDIPRVRNAAIERRIWSPRLEAFLGVFKPLLEGYEKRLEADGDVDFNDMIARAADYVEEGRYRSPYSSILVDEFQDISAGRARLIKALADQDDRNRLFCVGDDWQAIYRFAGSDISLMRDFEEHFGYAKTVTLDRTFRFNDRIERVARRFILANPAQISKEIRASKKAEAPRVFVHRPTGKGDDVLSEALGEIQRELGAARATVLVLGRYNFIQDGQNWSGLERQFPALELSFRTVHRAKGLEADYVVVLGMRSGKHGFPSEVADDPVLEAVLSAPEGFPHAEERRLFYVALTRARHAVHLVADYAVPSVFVDEILGYVGEVEGRGSVSDAASPCPSCEAGTLVQRTSRYGVFYGCSNYPLCTYKASPCPRCGTGILVRDRSIDYFFCSNVFCEHRERACPACADGRLVERIGQYGPFLGCTNYGKGICSYTEKRLGPRGRAE